MIDLEKYKDVMNFINSYNETIYSNRKWFNEEMKRHPADFVKISKESNREDDEVLIERLSKLNFLFPGIEFSKKDIELLSGNYERKINNFNIINRTSIDLESHRSRGGRTVSKNEIKRMNEASEKQPELEKQYEEAYSKFFEICEKLSGNDVLDNPNYDYEGEVFSTMYEQKFSLRPQNPILKKYYANYKVMRDMEKENLALSDQVQQDDEKASQLQSENEKLQNENNELKQKNSKLQSMLARTLEFCNSVRESKVGKFFFRKKIKELPQPQSMEIER